MMANGDVTLPSLSLLREEAYSLVETLIISLETICTYVRTYIHLYVRAFREDQRGNMRLDTVNADLSVDRANDTEVTYRSYVTYVAWTD
jgi:hypothetical protein